MASARDLGFDPQPGWAGSVAGSRPLTGLRLQFLEQEGETAYQQALRREMRLPLTVDSIMNSAVVPGPDIQWHPSYETYLRRVEALKQFSQDGSSEALPKGYTRFVNRPWAWKGSEIRKEDYLVQLTGADVNEVEYALGFFKGF
jgi:hypothetical protein